MGSKKACEHYWKPFKNDCEEFLGCFQQTETVRYEEFSVIWREMDFSSVFFGNQSHHEKKSFTRLALTIVCNYFIPPYSFQIRVGALYMLYALYNQQLVWPKEKIRVALKDWFQIQQFIAEAKTCQHLDVVYIFCRLLSDKAFYFTAMPKKLTFESSDRVQHDVNEDFRARKDKVAELASFEMLEEIANVHRHYERMKNSLLPPSAGVTLQNLAGAVQKCTLEYKQWQEQIAAARSKDATKKDANQKSESSDRADMLAAIKSKSYGLLTKESRSRRHRQIERVTTGYGTEFRFHRKKKPPSLRARTYRTLGDPGESEQTQEWLLSVMAEDKNARKSCLEINGLCSYLCYDVVSKMYF
ncbi:snRNA-activating protein complex subunit 1a [Triplophysa dalaica]|uniref:snRNA-activating protein complex subunit 1a n=1 Tax=Triplophysa dalaica TaxID=1582913 RepID=UPI0024DF78E4|nr:snRNA-activating protein complex subunit 1a [Triplophysa dalaica]